MGREHRLPRDPRIREAGDRRDARVPAAVQIRGAAYLIARTTTIAGIDVGEDFLDVAVIARRPRALKYRRIGIADVASIVELRARTARAIPELGRDAVALVDSPRWPRDLDLASGRKRRRAPTGRAIDVALRAVVGRLSMFPTPPLAYFAACVRDSHCKPHLRALGAELFARRLQNSNSSARVTGGRIFTRFMIAGFAVYRALEALGVTTFESYPDLAFRLWMRPRAALPLKSQRARALAMRRRIIAQVARLAAISAPGPRTLDECDAAILALGALAASRLRREVLTLETPAEGSFLIAGAVPSDHR